MPANTTTKQCRDASSAVFPVGFQDESGVGLGPFNPKHAAVDVNGAVVTPATDATLALLLQAIRAQAGSTGISFSVNAPALSTLGTLLQTIPAQPRAAIGVQNQGTSVIYLVRDDGTGNNVTVLVLAPAGNGSSSHWVSATFKGTLRIYGPASAQVAAYQD